MSATEKKSLEKLEKLHEEIEDLNNTQKVALNSLDCLSSTVTDIYNQIGQAFTLSTRRFFGAQGYINWFDHGKIHNQHWKKLSEFVEFCGAIERSEVNSDKKRPDMDEKVIVNEKTRFPYDSEDELYVNARSTSVLTVMLFIDEILKKLSIENRRGLTKHFLDFVKKDIHTRISFEDEYRLTWVEPRTYY